MAKNQTTNLFVLLPQANSEDNYWHYPMQGIKKAINDIQDFGVVPHIHTFPISSASEFEKGLQFYLKSNCQGILTTPMFPDILSQYISSEKIKNIVLVDSMLDTEKPICTIAQDASRSGRMAGALLYGLANTILITILISEHESMALINKRVSNFKTYLQEKNKNIRIDEIVVSADKIRESGALNNELIRKYDGIFVPNSRASYLFEHLDLCHQNIVGFDLTPKNRQLLQEEKIKFIICQRPESQGYQGLSALHEMVCNNHISTTFHQIPVDVLHAENFSVKS